MKAQCIRYIATDFHVDWFSSVLENQLQSWSTDFGFLPPSSSLSETAEASGVILQLRQTCVSHSAMTQKIEKQAKENRGNATHELEDKNVMAKKVQNQFSPGLQMSYQKQAADDSKPTGAQTSHIHKNRRISLYKNCTSKLHSDELRRVSIHISAAANHL